MTREERAKDYAEHNIGKYTNDYEIYNAYLKGAEEETKELLKENKELKKQLDKAEQDSISYFNKLCKAKEFIEEVAEGLGEFLS